MRRSVIERYVIPFFTKDTSQLEEPLMRWECEDNVRSSVSDLDKESSLYKTPRDAYLSRSPSSRHATSSVMRVVKGRDGKTFVNNVADVEAEEKEDDKDMFLISDDEVDKELKGARGSNMSVSRLSNSMRNSFH